jgi:tetratricopeptide (TPR) repeat protein
MAYNKTKHLSAAQKYLQQGKMPQAILEYQQILKNEPKDQVTLMTLGDLFVRQGETFQALEYFERLAKIFLSDGFTTKAIAIYKKVAKLAPEESSPLERLAELYVQQGVLSEARPIYLQLAEISLKAGKQPQAVTLLRKLLDAEPDNLRVQTKLAELLLTMGQQKDAIETFHAAMQRIHEQGDHAEAIRIGDRILKLDASHQPTLHLKVRVLTAAGKRAEAAGLLESIAHRDDAGDTASILLNLYLESGQASKAAELADKIYSRDPKQYQVPHQVAGALIEAGDFDRAHALLDSLRDTMIDSGDHEILAQTLTRLVERRPGSIEPLEWLVDLYGRASDSFRLPDALAQLAVAYESAGDDQKALATYEKLLERTPEDETTRRKYMRLRTSAGVDAAPMEMPPPVKIAPTEEVPQHVVAEASDSGLDEETQRYVTQALTDVDLFSSYGLTQKAIDLLEAVLERAPRHMPILERLLDLSVGAGNAPRTIELAQVLEQLASERDDHAGMERYAELRSRFQRAAGTVPAEAKPKAAPPAPPAPPAKAAQPAPPAKAAKPAAPAAAPPPEFAVPMIQAELDEPATEAAEEEAEILSAQPEEAPETAEPAVHEVDLSDEWAALSQQLETTMQEDAGAHGAEAAAEEPEPGVPEPVLIPANSAQAHAEAPSFDLELQAVAPIQAAPSDTLEADSLIADLAGELNSISAHLGLPEETAPTPMVMKSASVSSRKPAPSAPAPPPPAASKPSAPAAAGSGSGGLDGPLGDLFEEFRSELGESGTGDEDIETHYNLGIAYREMGLLEEAISEFQKVASTAEKGAAFRYAMQCSTLLGLAFMEKGQPAIAAIWYDRALKTPGLDQESILALRYDLGVAQELAGDVNSAFSSFSQVYATNIDYRDVSERIALLGKAR